MAEEKKDFVVKDRRFSSAEEPGEEKKPETSAKPEKEAKPEPGAFDSKTVPEKEPQLPEINFATFILSLHSSALVHLGIIENPATGEKTKSLGLAKQTIDILGIIEKKTQGNLEADEESLLKNILHDLRLMYVKEKG
ncbi:MAG: hypothetical protein COX20_10840 [Desulfobacterales bacterium CG23_combo_of_CG06-09_8_20_14_all_52_9]|nr:MAG: hypothetical protein COX20_10840 [Desulfobacterales bacterium CG23_combo_of_CG06-09_8_20_14_all_52_9]